MNDLTLKDILSSQSQHGDLYDPKYYPDDELLGFEKTILQVSKSDFLIKTSLSNDIEYDIDDEIASHLRHDFVATASWGSTDMSLKELGIDSILTPDCILKEEKKVLELATSFPSTQSALNSSFIGKRLAYESLFRNTAIKYFILIVSPRGVLSNCSLEQNVVSKLCQRCRCGLSIVATIEKLSGKVIQDYHGVKTAGNRAVKEKLMSLSSLNRNESGDMNLSVKTLATNDLGPEDDEWVKLIVNKSLMKSSERCKRKRNMDHEERVANSISEYVNELESAGTKKSKKRVTIFPMVVTLDDVWSQRRSLPRLGLNKTLPSAMFNLWSKYDTTQSWLDQKQYNTMKDKSKAESTMDQKPSGKHVLRHRSIMHANLSDADLDFIALSGPGAKLRAELKEVKEHESESKLSFSTNCNTSDIHEFIHSPLLTTHEHDSCVDDAILRGLIKSKKEVHENADTPGVFDWFRKNTISQHAALISEVSSELAYEYKVPHKENQWGLKICRNMPIMILFRCTGSHVFFSLAIEKKNTDIIDPGKIGPEIWETDNYYITDFSSISENGLNHYVKALPYVIGLQSSLYQLWGLPLPQRQVKEPESYWQCLKTIYLIYLNNKLDCEELVTSLRFLYMNLFQESLRDLSIFTTRLPSVLRSRLTVYLLNKTFSIMRHYSKCGVKRVRLRDKQGKPVYKVHSVRNVFCDTEFGAHQMVNSFYFGYVVSKERGRIGERDVKVVSKILTEEFWYLDNITSKNIVLWDRREKPLKHCWDPILTSYAIDHHLNQMNKIYGDGFKDILEQDLYDKISKASFIEIATLKASSREEEPNFYVPNPEHFSTHKQMKAELLRGNPTQSGTRPRVITKLFETVAKYITETGDQSPDVLSVAIWCLKELHKKGYFVADIFPKDQHGGDREIHVLHIYARLSQFLIELISITICDYFYHDSIAHPEYKDSYYQDHQKKATMRLGRHYTVCKSADATKWCQRNTSSQFYLILTRYCPSYYEPYFYCFFYLWTCKRIQLPTAIVANFERNKSVPSSNQFYVEVRKRFYSGTPPFPNTKQRNCATIKSGMWQGILHRASTLKHSIFQNFWKSYTESFLEQNGVKAVVDVIQGSDDSAALISLCDTRKRLFYAVEKLLEFKEVLGEFFCIWKSEAKSSVGTINLIEYNSEWIIDNAVVKPTMRWALSTLETTIVEKFINRYQIYYGTLQQTLESGGTTFLCSLLQMCQAYMHYMLLGIRNSILKDESMEMILKCHHPALGFFPLDTDLNAGLTGLDFLLFRTQRKFNVPTHTYVIEDLSPQANIEYEGKVQKDMSRDINSTKIPFANYKIWNKLVEEIGIESITELVKMIEQNPRQLYLPSKLWGDQQMSCALKLYQPGVKESLSMHQPNVRMAAASAYILTRPCMNAKPLGEEKRRSLYYMLSRSSQFYNDNNKQLTSEIQFPNQGEYEEFNDYLEHLLTTYFYQQSDMKRTGKYELAVWGSQSTSDVPITDLCMRAWWDYKSIKISNTMFRELWRQAKAKFGFLRDTESETKEATGLNSLELCNFLKSITSRVRKMKLQDVPAKGGSKEEVMTRLFWPSLKIRSDVNNIFLEKNLLRHRIFSILCYPYKLSFKRKLIIGFLEESVLLSRRFIDLPRAARRMKIFRDFLTTGNLINLISQIQQLKRGVIGFFVTRQDKGKGKAQKTYSGSGLWRGRVCGLGAQLSFNSEVCTEIRIIRLTDLLELSKTLKSVITEFKSKFPEMPEKSKSNLYLTSKGYFESNRYVVPNSIPVVIDGSVGVDVFDAVSDYDWSFKVSDTKLRIVCKASLDGGEERELTVLSDTYTSRDWDPSISEEFMDDPLFNSWQMSKPAKVTDILDTFGVDLSDRSINNMILKLKTERTLLKDNYDLIRFSKLLRSSISRSITGVNEVNIEDEPETSLPTVGMSVTDMALFNELCEWEDIEEDILNTIQEGAISESDIDSDEDLDDFDTIMDDAVDKIAEMFFSARDDDDSGLTSTFLGSFDMPESASFMKSITNWIANENHSDSFKMYFLGTMSKEEMRDKVHLPGELRSVMSVACGISFKDRYSVIRARELQDVSQAESMASSFTDEYLITKSSEELRDAITDMENFLPSARSVLKKKFESLIKKYKTELRALNSQGEHNMLGYIPYWLFIDKLISEIKKKGIWKKEIIDADLITIRSIVIADCMDVVARENKEGLMPDLLREDMFSVAWSDVVTSGLCKLLSHGLKVDMSVYLNEECAFYSNRDDFNKDLILNFAIKEIESRDSDTNFGR